MATVEKAPEKKTRALGKWVILQEQTFTTEATGPEAVEKTKGWTVVNGGKHFEASSAKGAIKVAAGFLHMEEGSHTKLVALSAASFKPTTVTVKPARCSSPATVRPARPAPTTAIRVPRSMVHLGRPLRPAMPIVR